VNVAARIRLLLARSPWLYWAIVASLAGAAALFVMRAADGVDAARDAWGEPSAALVATRDVEPGATLDGATELRELPGPMVPAGALTERGLGAVARQRIAAGEVVVEHDVAPNAAPRALIPDGWRAVAVSEPVASGAQVGDEVSVASGGVVLAADGVVVGLAGEALLVAVPADEAAQVAHAAAGGDVAVLLKP
jgi:hypothetical protein